MMSEHKCKYCHRILGSPEELAEHKVTMMDNGQGHVHCRICWVDFECPESILTHNHRFHPAKQDLTCPGCQAKAQSATELFGHAMKQCPVIGPADIDRNRAKKLSFMGALRVRHEVPFIEVIPANIIRPDGTTSDVPTRWAHRPFINWRTADADRFHESDFPRLFPPAKDEANGKGPDADAMVALPNRHLLPSPPEAFHLTQSQLVALEKTFSEEELEVWRDDIGKAYVDPNHPNYNVMIHFDNHVKLFICPFPLCTKSFKKREQLNRHLDSPYHEKGMFLFCHQCNDAFVTTIGLLAHCESQGHRCRVRDASYYRTYVDLLTGGLIDVVGRHPDGTVKYGVPDSARRVFGPKDAGQRGVGNFGGPRGSRQVPKQPEPRSPGNTGAFRDEGSKQLVLRNHGNPRGFREEGPEQSGPWGRGNSLNFQEQGPRRTGPWGPGTGTLRNFRDESPKQPGPRGQGNSRDFHEQDPKQPRPWNPGTPRSFREESSEQTGPWGPRNSRNFHEKGPGIPRNFRDESPEQPGPWDRRIPCDFHEEGPGLPGPWDQGNPRSFYGDAPKQPEVKRQGNPRRPREEEASKLFGPYFPDLLRTLRNDVSEQHGPNHRADPHAPPFPERGSRQFGPAVPGIPRDPTFPEQGGRQFEPAVPGIPRTPPFPVQGGRQLGPNNQGNSRGPPVSEQAGRQFGPNCQGNMRAPPLAEQSGKQFGPNNRGNWGASPFPEQAGSRPGPKNQGNMRGPLFPEQAGKHFGPNGQGNMRGGPPFSEQARDRPWPLSQGNSSAPPFPEQAGSRPGPNNPGNPRAPCSPRQDGKQFAPDNQGRPGMNRPKAAGTTYAPGREPSVVYSSDPTAVGFW